MTLDRRLERDMRVFISFLRHDGIPESRIHELALLASQRASNLPGPPSSLAWFTGWAEVLKEQGSPAENDAARHGLQNVRKLWDAGF